MKHRINTALATSAALLATVGAAAAQSPTVVTDALEDASGWATTIGTAGLTLLGVFIGFKLLKRAASKLV